MTNEIQARVERRARVKNLRQAAALIENAFDWIPNGYLADEQRLALRRAASDLREAANEEDVDD
jgi:hypothetical protein